MFLLFQNPLVWKTCVSAVALVSIIGLLRARLWAKAKEAENKAAVPTTVVEHEKERFRDNASQYRTLAGLCIIGIILIILVIPCLWIFA